MPDRRPAAPASAPLASPPFASPLATTVMTAFAITAFAGNSLLTRAALGSGLIEAGAFSALRLVAGAAILLPWFLRGGPAWPSARQALSLLAYVVAFSFAYRALNAAMGAMILFAAVQATIIVAAWASGVGMRGIEMAGIATALLGMVVLLGTGGGGVPLLAALAMAAAGIAWGLYTILGRSSADPARSTAGNFLLAAVLAAPLPLLDGAGSTTMAGLWLALAAGALTSGLGYVAWYAVVPRLRHATIGAAQLATPVIAAIGGALLLAEPLTLRLAVSAGLILGGIALTLRPRR